MDRNEMICWCKSVTAGDIMDAMDRGAKSLGDVRRMTGAGTDCHCAERNPSGK